MDKFFAETKELVDSARISASLHDFLSTNDGTKTVLVTSGGTTVPLERRCIRFIDNFSAGTRGARSVERFLENGYRVVFLTRHGSIKPFCDGLPHADAWRDISRTLGGATVGPDGSLTAAFEGRALSLVQAMQAQRRAEETGRILTIEYSTVFEYLQLLRLCCQALRPLGTKAMVYLAAAVSDFYIPWPELPEHKIQSDDGPLTLQLQKVPKVLGTLRKEWCPEAFAVSFKLETDEGLLLQKAQGAIDRYGVHSVVANLLHDRKDRVIVLDLSGATRIERQEDPDIELRLSADIAGRHQAYIDRAGPPINDQ